MVTRNYLIRQMMTIICLFPLKLLEYDDRCMQHWVSKWLRDDWLKWAVKFRVALIDIAAKFFFVLQRYISECLLILANGGSAGAFGSWFDKWWGKAHHLFATLQYTYEVVRPEQTGPVFMVELYIRPPFHMNWLKATTERLNKRPTKLMVILLEIEAVRQKNGTIVRREPDEHFLVLVFLREV
jgi:hypothetical protein